MHRRIAALVDAVRSSARQERAEAADIDVHEQIKSVLAVLDHKLKSVHVTQHFAADCGPRARLSERTRASVGEPAR